MEPMVVACGVVAAGWVLWPESTGILEARPGVVAKGLTRRRLSMVLAVALVLGTGWWVAYSRRWGREAPSAVGEVEARAYFAHQQPRAFRLWEQQPTVSFQEVRRYQYEHAGAVDGLAGHRLLWRGELGYCGPGFRYVPAGAGVLELVRKPGWSVIRLVVGRDAARGVFGVGDVRVNVRGELPVSLAERPGAVLARVVGTDLFGGVVLEGEGVLLR